MPQDFVVCSMAAHPHHPVFILSEKVSAVGRAVRQAAKVAGIILVFGVLSTAFSSNVRASAGENNSTQSVTQQSQEQPAEQPAVTAEQSTAQPTEESIAQAQDPNNDSQKATVPQQNAEEPNEAADSAVVSESPYLRAVREFADNVLKYGRDTYGPKHTPLFVDGLNTETLDPVVWHNKGEEWILCNFANHQSLLRLLDGLTALTGEGKYRQAALDASAYALANLRTPNGLLYWGGHMAWDLQKDRGVFQGEYETHELRQQSPYYELLWEANPQEAGKLMEAIWGSHVWDWAKLDFNRHASSTTEPRPAQWTHEFDENLSCPFPSVTYNLSFSNFAGPLLHTGALLAKLGNHREALLWTKRFAQRWHSACHPVTGLCGGLLSHPRNNRAHISLAHNHPNILEAAMVAGYMMHDRYNFLTLCQMQVGEELDDDGREMIQWASDDLEAFAHHVYDEDSLSFRPVLTDGTELKWRECNPGYFSPGTLAPQKASDWTLWVYATAYRLTRDTDHWKFLRSVWRGLDLGDLGTESGDERHLNYELKATSYPLLYACLELYSATKDESFLMLAQRVADNILAARTQDRCLPKDYFYVRTGDEAMLAVLHLSAVLQGKSHKIPQPRADRQYFHCAFSGAVGSGRTVTDARVWDQSLIYSKRKEYSILPAGSTEPPVSIGEAISMGNMEIVKALYAQRTDFENMHNLLFPAVQSSYKGTVEFFLAKGADVNSRNGWPEETPMHHAAALKDGREIIELLIDKGADLNAKNWKGDTPLQYAAYYDHEKISELLLQKGAKITNLHIASYMGDLGRAEAFIKEGVDINARDGHGYVPLHYAARERQEQAIELLLASGADLEAKNWKGRTPFALAIERGHKDIAELLANKGANVNSADNEGSALLHRTVQNGQGDVAAFLIDEGVDVNTKNNKGYTPLYEAVWNSDANMVELLVLNGADVDAKNNSGYIPLSEAIWNEDREMIKRLVANGADVNFVAKDDWPFLHYLAENNDRELVELFLAHGAKLNVKDNIGRTELHIAVSEGNQDLARFLVSKGATASELHLAACLGDLARVKSLAEEGVDVDTKDEAGWTPLYWAASMAEEEVAEFLIGKGAGIDVRGNINRTSLHQAAFVGAAKLASLLISKGADPNARGKDNGTPLHLAAAGGHKDVVQLLLANGVDVNVENNQGRTPLAVAQRRGQAEIIEILTKAAEKQRTD